MQKDSSNVYASGCKCFDNGIRDEVGMFSLQSERASASSFARQKEMIELKLKQTELRLELELAKEEAERIRKEAEFQRLKREIELEKKRTELEMELLELKAMSSGSSRPKRIERLHRESLIDHGPDKPVAAQTLFLCLWIVLLALMRQSPIVRMWIHVHRLSLSKQLLQRLMYLIRSRF